MQNDDRTCTACDETKAATSFHGHRRVCKSCVNAKAREAYAADPEPKRQAALTYRADNLETVRAKDRARSKGRDHTAAQARYRERNRDQINASRRAERAANPEATRAKDRERYQSNRESFAAASRRWKAANPDKLRQYDERRRAQKAGAPVSAADFRALYAQFPDCYLCGRALDGDTHMDHVVPLARGGEHSATNLRPTHAACNLRKSDKLLAELDWCVTRP
jgi:5-methylcytosine-specific restriction endonuclease McrA